MTPPASKSQHSDFRALAMSLLLFFIGMKASFGMIKTSGNSNEKRSLERLNNASLNTTELTEKNRRESDSGVDELPLVDSDEDDDENQKLVPRRLSTDARLITAPQTSFSNATSEITSLNAAAPKSKNYATKKSFSPPHKTASQYKASNSLCSKTIETEKKLSQLFAEASRIKIQFEKKQTDLECRFLEQQEALLQTQAALNLSRGISPAFHPPKTILSALKKNYSRQEGTIKLGELLDCYHLDGELLSSYLLKRQAILPDNPEAQAEIYHLNKKAAEALTSAQELGILLIQNLVPSFQVGATNEVILHQLEDLSQAQIEYLYQTIALVREIQLFSLGCHTSPYITASKKKLDEIEAYLAKNTAIEEKPISQNIRDQYIGYKNLLSESKAIFSLKETVSAAKAIEAAKESASIIDEQLTKIKQSHTSFIELKPRTEECNKQILEAEAEVMKQLTSCFQDAMCAYCEIRDEAEIEKMSGPLHVLKQKIQYDSSSLLKKAETLAINKDVIRLLEKLNTLLEQEIFQPDEAHLLPQHPEVFLDHLEKLGKSLDSQCIIGTHGKIALDTLPKKANGAYSLAVKQEWSSGTDSIRNGLCRGWGIHILKQFDQDQEALIRMNAALFVSNIKQFLYNEEGHPKYTRSYFIPPETTYENFLEELEKMLPMLARNTPHFNKTKAHRVIKIDQATMDFNPFAKKPFPPSQETLDAAELRQRKTGFEYVRKALESAFPEASLLPKQLDEVLQRFDNQYKIDHSIAEKPPLTLVALADFLQTQKAILKKRSYWKRNIAPYLDRDALIANALNGISYTIGSHLGTIILFTLPYLYLLWLTHIIHTTSSST